MTTPAPGSLALENVRLVGPAGAPGDDLPPAGARAAVLFEDGAVRAVRRPQGGERGVPFAGAGAREDGGGRWLLPGWIDIQLNDIEWLALGAQEAAAHAERVREVSRYQTRRGVTGFILATLAAPTEEVLGYLRGVRQALDASGGGDGGSGAEAACLGALVEGSFMNPEFHGAHNPRYVVPPEIPLLDAFVDTGAVRLVNIAPEMSPAALEVIAHARGRGVVVGVGHAKPSAERVRVAVEAGLRYVIHLGNGPTGSSWKGFGGGGLFEEALFNDDLIVTVIVDGYHLDLRLVRDIVARKGIDRVIAVSDAGFATGHPGGDFEVFGVRGRVAGEGSYLEVIPPLSAPVRNAYSSDCIPLFGSAADMSRVFECCLNLLARDVRGVYQREHGALGLEHALAAASALCSKNPARLLGEERRGALEEGFRADAVLVSIDGEPGSYRVAVERTWVGGVEVG